MDVFLFLFYGVSMNLMNGPLICRSRFILSVVSPIVAFIDARRNVDGP